MDIKEKSMMQLEVLISTMHRNSLDFLDAMFINNDISQASVLIINQTNQKSILTSERDNIRVINVFERGLSKSRNLAIENAIAPVVLLSDDDVVFEKGFNSIILQAFQELPDADLITFKTKNFTDGDHRLYPSNDLKYNLKTLRGVLSIEIAFKLHNVRDLSVKFDERFGLGSEFETSEEYLFVREIVKKGGQCYFNNNYIVSHEAYNSGMAAGSDKIIYARAALNFKLYGYFGYAWLIKYLFYLIRHRMIKSNEITKKWKVGIKGINDYVQQRQI